MKSNLFKLTITGFISGLLSHFLPEYFILQGLSLKPGIIFATGVALFFFVFNRSSFFLTKSIIWISLSAVSYYSAVWSTLLFAYFVNNNDASIEFLVGPGGIPSFIIGGLVGGFLMLMSFRNYLYPITLTQVMNLTMLAGLLGLAWYVVPNGIFFGASRYGDLSQEKLLGLFVFWQMGMAGALGWVMDKADNGKNR